MCRGNLQCELMKGCLNRMGSSKALEFEGCKRQPPYIVKRLLVKEHFAGRFAEAGADCDQARYTLSHLVNVWLAQRLWGAVRPDYAGQGYRAIDTIKQRVGPCVGALGAHRVLRC